MVLYFLRFALLAADCTTVALSTHKASTPQTTCVARISQAEAVRDGYVKYYFIYNSRVHAALPHILGAGWHRSDVTTLLGARGLCGIKQLNINTFDL